MAIAYKDNHATEALANLVSQFQGKTYLAGVLTAFVNQIQELENVCFELLSQRWLDNAEGAQLDGFGSIVGEAREGRTDDDYRLAIQARILLNLSSGTPEDIIALARALTDGSSVLLAQYFPAYFTVEILEPLASAAIAEKIASFIEEASPAGVGSGLIYTLSPVGEDFTFAEADIPTSSTTQGWADDAQTSGGYWADLVEI